MDIDDIRALKHQKPFVPFDIVMEDGKALFVELPFRIALSPNRCMAYLFVGDVLEIIEVPQVKELRLRAQSDAQAA